MVLLLLLLLAPLCQSAVIRQAVVPGSVGRLGTCAIQVHCAAGLICIHGECLQLVREGDACGATWQTCGSTATVQCTGPTGDRRCRTLVSLGGACGAPWRVCAPPLTCIGEEESAACYQPVRSGARCDRPFRTCQSGNRCGESELSVMLCMPIPTTTPEPKPDAGAESEAESEEAEPSSPPVYAFTSPPVIEPIAPTVTPTPEYSMMAEPEASMSVQVPEPSADVLSAMMVPSSIPSYFALSSTEPSKSAFASLPPMPSGSCLPCPSCTLRAGTGCDCIQSSSTC